MVITLIYLIIFNLLFFIFYARLQRIFNIYDHPDQIRKKQKNKVPITGGLLIISNYIFIICLNKFYNFNFFNYLEITKIDFLFVFILIPIFFYIIGLYDDKYQLKPFTKLFLSLILFYIITNLDQIFLLSQINIQSFNLNFSIIKFSIFITLLCYLLFQHAFNMFDGINLQISFYSLFFLIILFIITKIDIFLLLILPFLFFLILNFKNQSYMGDGGCYFISYFFSIHCVIFYNLEKINSEEIFLLMMIPGVDMFRLFIYRLLKGSSPFNPDRKHLHHYLISKFSNKVANLISMLLIITPLVSYMYYRNFTAILIISILTYLLIIYFITKKS